MHRYGLAFNESGELVVIDEAKLTEWQRSRDSDMAYSIYTITHKETGRTYLGLTSLTPTSTKSHVHNDDALRSPAPET
jgi:hypothetical protein